ncbi:cupin domain-containing protein [Thiomicrorhabdus sp. zzn3]|uniref:cupin domain-containing protein n=1 Tax=Thiomicrorhabdus sp. zzn3 TaxID=3039775 RepID=UPI002436C889|nr:cupin domain-containing protein [Thiomicrorhabdus sp. zzn3]MDG6777861.1 cupin domain-containing protein [Thiomicrorhabdus sp. zzn3]
MKITIESNPSESTLQQLQVRQWPIWEKQASEFPWFYDAEEVCFLLEGKVTVTPENGEAVDIKAGDLVTFPKGMACRWHIHQAVKKHYQFR